MCREDKWQSFACEGDCLGFPSDVPQSCSDQAARNEGKGHIFYPLIRRVMGRKELGLYVAFWQYSMFLNANENALKFQILGGGLTPTDTSCCGFDLCLTAAVYTLLQFTFGKMN